MEMKRDEMKAARFYKPNQPLRLEDIPTPKIGRDEALVEVKACGICHSDLHIIEGKIRVPRVPLVLGHEISGKLVQLGSKMEQLSEGDRVLLSGVTSCGYCRYCGSGLDNIYPSKLELGIQCARAIKHHGMLEHLLVRARFWLGF